MVDSDNTRTFCEFLPTTTIETVVDLEDGADSRAKAEKLIIVVDTMIDDYYYRSEEKVSEDSTTMFAYWIVSDIIAYRDTPIVNYTNLIKLMFIPVLSQARTIEATDNRIEEHTRVLTLNTSSCSNTTV